MRVRRVVYIIESVIWDWSNKSMAIDKIFFILIVVPLVLTSKQQVFRF